ncbi:hypothetical protein ACEQ8H_001550 [Pleosporales sp. CAS-2024a]
MFALLPSPLVAFLFALPALSHASPSPSLVSTDFEISLIPRHQLFLRQLSDLQTFSSALGGAKAPPITDSGDPQRPFLVGGDTFTDFASAGERSCDIQFQACQAIANGNGGGGGGGNSNQAKAKSQSQRGGSSGRQRKQKSNEGANHNSNANNNNNNNNSNSNNGRANADKNSAGTNKTGGQNRRDEAFGNETDSYIDDLVARQNGGINVNQCDQQKNQCKSEQDLATIKNFSTAVASTNIGPDPNFPDFDLICEG